MTAVSLESPPCASCGAEDYRVLFERHADLHDADHFAATTDDFRGFGRIVSCARCGLARLHPRQRPEFLLSAYAGSEDPLYLEEEPGRLASARRIVRYLERHARPGRLLDVGCGAGMLLAAARPAWETQGVELSSWAARHARERYGLAVHEGTILDARFPAAHFDAVTMLDVIEHLADPLAAVTEAARVLKPGGVAYLLTPDFGAPVARLMGRWWWGLRPAHLYYFTASSLTGLLRRAGLSVREVRRPGRTFTFGYWLSRLRGYAEAPVDLAGRTARALGLASLPLYLNTFDSLGILARKEPA